MSGASHPLEAIRAPRWFAFALGARRYAFEVETVGEVRELGAIRRIPGLPEAILGLTDCRGRLISVVDLSTILGVRDPGGPRCLVRLTPPYEGIGIVVPFPVQLETEPGSTALAILKPDELLHDLLRS